MWNKAGWGGGVRQELPGRLPVEFLDTLDPSALCRRHLLGGSLDSHAQGVFWALVGGLHTPDRSRGLEQTMLFVQTI